VAGFSVCQERFDRPENGRRSNEPATPTHEARLSGALRGSATSELTNAEKYRQSQTHERSLAVEIIISDTGDTRSIKLIGRLDTLTAPELERPLKESCEQWQSTVVDCERLDYVSSAGLRVLLTGQKAASVLEHSLTLVNVADDVREVFDITGFSRILSIE
jgi:anti-anti-sigma factor